MTTSTEAKRSAADGDSADGALRLRLGSSGRGQGLVWRGNVQVPMITIHLAHHIGTSSIEHVVEILDLLLPALVGSTLLVGEEEILAAVEDAIGSRGSMNIVDRFSVVEREASMRSSNVKHTLKTEEQGGCSTSLENELVREDKHAGLGQEVGVDGRGFDGGEDLAVDKIEHGLPDFLGDGLETD